VAIQTAAAIGAYAIWGVFPFLRLRQLLGFDLQPLVLGDPLLQRIMGTTVVNPLKIAGVNSTGALALQQFLLTPAAQVQIRAFRVPGVDQQLWWPAGRNNDPMALPH
jgi:ABC-type tungstate transport system permease subunit